jgi:DNA-binding transcriptional LysR family regulator
MRDNGRVELRHLEYFVAVAEELSFTRASRRLHVVQSGVSSAIQSLERELGAALFDRDRHRVALTDAGQALLPEARATLAAAQAAREAVGETRSGLRGTVTVGTMQSVGQLDLPALLGRFHTTHPDVAVRLRLASSGSAGLAREVISGALDLAVLSLPGQPPAGLALRFVSAEPLLVVCHPAHPLAARRSATLEEIADEAFIDFTPGWGNRVVVDRAFAAAGLERQVRFEVADFASAAALVRHGLGIAFLPASVAAAASDLPAIEVAGTSLTWQISVATPAHRRASAASRAFLAELLRAAGSSPE